MLAVPLVPRLARILSRLLLVALLALLASGCSQRLSRGGGDDDGAGDDDDSGSDDDDLFNPDDDDDIIDDDDTGDDDDTSDDDDTGDDDDSNDDDDDSGDDDDSWTDDDDSNDDDDDSTDDDDFWADDDDSGDDDDSWTDDDDSWTDDDDSYPDGDGDLWSVADGDCDDTDASINPGAPEGDSSNNGNGIDDDCDGLVDEGTNDYDDDGDGFTDNDGDCNDFNPAMFPTNPEDPSNGIDDDCDGQVDELPICDCPSTTDPALAFDACEGLISAPVSGPSYGVISSYGPYSPSGGCRMLYLSSGVLGGPYQIGTDFGPSDEAGDTSTLTLSLQVPTWSSSFSFRLNFMSAEYPEWINAGYNDFFWANLSSGAFNGNISFDGNGDPINVDNNFFNVISSSALSGTGMEGGVGGGTGWLTTTSPVIPGETVTLELTIGDVGDGIYDSIVLLDDFQWSVDEVTAPETQQ